MLLCILGFSASGKNTLTEEMINNYGFKRVVQYTSRPQRESEINEIDYHFISQSNFEKGITNNVFLSHREFDTEKGKWYYGLKKDSLNLNDNKILIIDIEGLIDLKKNLKNDNILSVFIDVDLNLRFTRVQNRMDVDLLEFKRRAKDDESKRELILRNCDTVLKNTELDSCLLELQNFIEDEISNTKTHFKEHTNNTTL